jgi:hypothetical protein
MFDVSKNPKPDSNCNFWCILRLLKRTEIGLVALMLIFAGACMALIMVLYLYFYAQQQATRKQVLSEQSVGQVITVSQSGGLFARSLVQTDVGFYALVDAISLSRNETLLLQTRADQSRFLCDSQHRCVKLAATEQGT